MTGAGKNARAATRAELVEGGWIGQTPRSPPARRASVSGFDEVWWIRNSPFEKIALWVDPLPPEVAASISTRPFVASISEPIGMCSPRTRRCLVVAPPDWT